MRGILIGIGLIFGTLRALSQVVPYQPGAYYPGLTPLRDYTAGPSGFYVFNYNYFINSKGYYNSEGDKHTEITTNGVPSGIIDSDLSGYVNVPAVAYLSDWKILGGRYQAMLQLTYLDLDYTALVLLGEETRFSGRDSGWGDMTVSPLGISWSLDRKVDIIFSYTAYIPTGKYDTESESNVGQGYWTHQIQLPVDLYFNEQSTALGVVPTLELNGEIIDAPARIGNRFSLEYGISQYITEWLEIELVNAHTWQISDDIGEAVWWQGTPFDSRDGRHSISAGIGFWPGVDWLNARVRYTSDYSARQSFKANIFSFSFLFLPGQIKS